MANVRTSLTAPFLAALTSAAAIAWKADTVCEIPGDTSIASRLEVILCQWNTTRQTIDEIGWADTHQRIGLTISQWLPVGR